MTSSDPELNPQFADSHPTESDAVVPDSMAAASPVPAANPWEIDAAESSRERVIDFHRKLIAATPRAFVTPILIGINVVVFIAMVASGVDLMQPTGGDILKWGANFALKTLDGEWWRLITCCFLHIGLMHLLLNMWVLADVGILVERMFGNRRFLGLYLFSGLCGSLASLFWNPMLISAGASGAVFGVYGALLGALIRRSGSIPVEALSNLRNSGLTFVAFNLFFGLIHPNIDSAAHLGGLAGGFLCGLVLHFAIASSKSYPRPILSVLVGTAALLILFGGALGVYSRHGDLVQSQRELDRFAVMEAGIIERVNSAVAKVQKMEMNDQEFADVLKNDALSEWRDSISRLSQIKAAGPFKATIESLLEYMRLREAHWSLLEQACRAGDPKLAAEAGAKGEIAEAALQRLLQQVGKK